MTDNMQRAGELLAAERAKPRDLNDSPVMVEASDALRAIAAALRLAVPEWRPIETAPKDGTIVLGYDDSGVIAAMRFAVPMYGGHPSWELAELSWANDSMSAYPTHWMPLPAAPTVPAEGDG